MVARRLPRLRPRPDDRGRVGGLQRTAPSTQSVIPSPFDSYSSARIPSGEPLMPTRHPLSFLDAQVDRRTVLRGSLLAIALGTFGTACASSKASDQNGTRTLVEAIASMPGGLAFDAKPGGYEGFEFTQLTGAGLIRNPYIQDPDDPGAMRQDLYR